MTRCGEGVWPSREVDLLLVQRSPLLCGSLEPEAQPAKQDLGCPLPQMLHYTLRPERKRDLPSSYHKFQAPTLYSVYLTNRTGPTGFHFQLRERGRGEKEQPLIYLGTCGKRGCGVCTRVRQVV